MIRTNKKISLGLAISLMAIVAAITFIISTSYSMNLYNGLVADVQQRAEMYTKLEKIDTYVRAYYNGTINEDKLIESLAEAYVSVLGSNNARYYDTDEYTVYKEHIGGTHHGIGIYAEKVGGCPCVTYVLANSPAASAGINIGDSIVAINGQSVLEMGYTKAYSMLRAEKGTVLNLTVRSGGEDRNVTLATVQMTAVSVKTAVFGNYGYIKVSEFSENTYQQFAAAYSMLLSLDETKGIIIDLRNNNGMIFEPVFNLLNTILPKGSVPYMSLSLSGTETPASPASGTSACELPVAVLINQRTSGPSELFAASLRDNLGAKIVGGASSGNAEQYETFALYDNTAISLPIATLRSLETQFNGTGVKPEYEILMTSDTEADLSELDETTDPCIKKALEILSQQ